MSQHDLTIANQGFPAFRADLNDALQALGSCQSGTSAPSPTFANQLWYDTTNNILKIRNEDNDAWISIATLDQSGDLVALLVANTVNSVGDSTINGLTVGKGGGAQSLNSAFGVGALVNNTTANANTAVGYQAGYSNTTGGYNTALGGYALKANTSGVNNVALGSYALYSSTTSNSNTGVGTSALESNTTGASNVSVGTEALKFNTTASNNTAVGYQAGYNGTTGDENVAIGAGAMYSTTTGNAQVAVGRNALNANTTGAENTAVGRTTLLSNTTGNLNSGMGRGVLQNNTTGSYNTGSGAFALYSNTTASRNTAVGYQAGYSNNTTGANTYIGYRAGYNANGAANGLLFVGDSAGENATTGTFNTFIGQASGSAVTSGSKNTILGRYDGNQGGLDIRTASNYIVLSDGDGNPRIYTDNNGKVFLNRVPNGGTAGTDTTVISNTGTTGQLILQYYTTPVNFGIGVTSSNLLSIYDGGGTQQAYFQASNGNAYNRGGTWGTISDIKLKENVVDATPKLDKVMQLKVRNFNLIGNDVKQIGFIAQEFQQVFPSVVEAIDDTNEDGSLANTQTLHIKSSVLIPILVKAIQELKQEVDSLKQQIASK